MFFSFQFCRLNLWPPIEEREKREKREREEREREERAREREQKKKKERKSEGERKKEREREREREKKLFRSGPVAGTNQIIFVREGFWQMLWIFGGHFWKSFPYRNPRKSQEKPKKNQEKTKKN